MTLPHFGKVVLGLAGTVPYRRNTRLLLGLPITLTGKDELGRPLQETTRTVDVGKHGARIETLRPPLPKAEIGIRCASAAKTHSARVIWEGGRKRPDGLTEIGVEFLPPFDAEAMWAVKPPDDWRAGPVVLTATQKLEYFAARDLEVPIRAPEHLADDEFKMPPLPRPQDSQPARDRTLEGAPEEAIPHSEGLEPRGEEGPPDVALPSDQTGARAASHSNPPPMIAAEPAGKVSGGSGERPSSPVNAVAEKLSTSAVLELINRLVQTLTEQADAISNGQEKAVSSVQSAAQEAESKLQGVRKQVEESLQAASEEYQKQFAQLGAASTEELRRTSQELMESFRGQVEKTFPAHTGLDQEELQRELVELATGMRNEFFRMLKDQERKYAASLSQIETLARANLATRPPETSAARSTSTRRALMGALGVLAAAATAFLAFVYLSTQPVLRLPTNPPAEFLEPDPSWNANRKAAELGLARAYWDLAVRKLQPAYSMEAQLPDQPPPEFNLDPQSAPETLTKANLQASRQRYWQKLRTIWGNPQIRAKMYEWNTSWLGSQLQPLGEELRKLIP